jgi:hypothetical protein
MHALHQLEYLVNLPAVVQQNNPSCYSSTRLQILPQEVKPWMNGVKAATGFQLEHLNLMKKQVPAGCNRAVAVRTKGLLPSMAVRTWGGRNQAGWRWFGWAPSLGPHHHDPHVSVTTMRGGSGLGCTPTKRLRPAWRGCPFLPNSFALHPAGSAAPHAVSCPRASPSCSCRAAAVHRPYGCFGRVTLI